MRKLYTFLTIGFIGFIGFIGNAQVINFPDANFKAKLLAADSSNNIASTGFPAVPTKIDSNNDGEIEQSEALLIVGLRIDNSDISDLTGLEYFHNLDGLDASNNPLTTFSQNGMPNLHELILQNCNLTSIDFSGYTSLWVLLVMNNSLSSLSLSSITHLFNLDCSNNNLTTIDITGCSELTGITLSNNQLTSITFPALTHFDLGIPIVLDNNLFETITAPNIRIGFFSCSDNPNLRYLNIKEASHDQFGSASGAYFHTTYHFSNCPLLEYVCAREEDVADTQAYISSHGYTNCHVNTYCTFTPGGTFYTIEGTNRLDANVNGCDAADGLIPNMKYIISNGLSSTTLVANDDGSYHYDVQAGTYTITPVFENGANFTASPASATVTFPGAGTSFTQDFCITANNPHYDLEIAIYPLDPARPGFDGSYKIIYKNNGTQIQNNSAVFLTFNDSVLDLVSATPNVTSQTGNTLRWDYTNLLPFETREITFVMNVNSPTETPAVNAGDILNFNAFAWATAFEETIENNSAVLNQAVVNSFDPNDKTCAEGANLSIEEVGKYLHYIIRFENTGTANAENIVVKDIIDTTKFDISTLVPLHGSHPFETKISSGNKVEFIFENINLPFDDANNDGYVAFKIKTLPTLAIGDNIINSASIYFDYNFPIVTDPYTVTVYNPLSTVDFDFGSVYTLSPIPVKNILKITTKKDVVISSVNIYNTLGQLVQVNTNPSETIDVSSLKTGSYFIKIISDKGTAGSKFVKE